MVEYEEENRSDINNLINKIEEIITSNYLKLPLTIIKSSKIKKSSKITESL